MAPTQTIQGSHHISSQLQPTAASTNTASACCHAELCLLCAKVSWAAPKEIKSGRTAPWMLVAHENEWKFGIIL